MENFAIKARAFQIPFILKDMLEAEKAGLAWGGKDEEGNQTYIGTKAEWDKKTIETENPWGDRDYPDMGDKVNDDLLDR